MDKIMQYLMSIESEEDRLDLVEKAFNDSKRLDKLQKLNERSEAGTCGVRVYDDGSWEFGDSQAAAEEEVRDAIDKFFAEVDPEGEIYG